MPLPPTARERLALPLRSVRAASSDLHDWHTLPIDQRIWNIYSAQTTRSVQALTEALAARVKSFLVVYRGFCVILGWLGAECAEFGGGFLLRVVVDEGQA